MRKFVLMRNCPEIVSKNKLETRIALVYMAVTEGKQTIYSSLSSSMNYQAN